MHPLFSSGLGIFRDPSAGAADSMWWGLGDCVYWCNSEAGTIHLGTIGSAVNGVDDQVLQLPPILAAFAPAPDGFVIASKNAVAIVGPLGTFLRTLARITHKSDRTRFSSAVCDPYGRFILCAGGIDGSSNGVLYSVDPEGESRSIYEAAGLVTGMQWSDDGGTMWFTDTRVATIFIGTYSPRGELSNVRPFITGVRGEGLARDIGGGFWTSTEGGGRIARWDGSGQLTVELEIPAGRVSALAFGGPGMSTLFVATSQIGMNSLQLSAKPLSGAIFGIETATQGYPTRPFGMP